MTLLRPLGWLAAALMALAALGAAPTLPPRPTPTAHAPLYATTLTLQRQGERETPLPASPSPYWPALWGGLLGAALATAVGALLRRSRAGSPVAAPKTTTERRLLAAATITTARHAPGPVDHAGLRAVLWEGRRRRVVELQGRHWTIGSDPGCTLVVAGPGVAALHARLSATGDGLSITDLDSSGGTRVGALGPRLVPGAPTPLAQGEPVLIGEEVRLMLEG